MPEEKANTAYSVRLSEEVKNDLTTLINQIKKEKDFENNSSAYDYLIKLANKAISDRPITPELKPILERANNYLVGIETVINELVQSYKIFIDESSDRESKKLEEYKNNINSLNTQIKKLEEENNSLSNYISELETERQILEERNKDLKEQLQIYKETSNLKELFEENGGLAKLLTLVQKL